MKTSSTIPMRGDLTVRTRDAATGRVLRTYEIRNTVTYIGMGVMVNLISQRAIDTAPAQFKIATLKVGTGTTPPVRGDSALVDASPFVIPVDDVNKTPNTIGPHELRVSVTLGSGDANGKLLAEAGLFTAGGQLFARQVHPAIQKEAAIAIDYDWRIAFTA
jgi:hypothetical protein